MTLVFQHKISIHVGCVICEPILQCWMVKLSNLHLMMISPMETFEKRASRRYISGSNQSCLFSCYPAKCHNVSLFVYYNVLVSCHSYHSFCILLLFTIESFIHSCFSIVVIRSFQTSSLHPPKGSDSQTFLAAPREPLFSCPFQKQCCTLKILLARPKTVSVFHHIYVDDLYPAFPSSNWILCESNVVSLSFGKSLSA